MEKLKAKHDHLLTKLLKVGIFTLVLLLPFFVFMPTAFYYGFNEHAQVEIPQKNAQYKTNEVNSIDDLVIGNIYKYEETLDITTQNNPTYLNDNTIINIVNKDIDNIITFVKDNEIRINSYSEYSILELNNIDYFEIGINPNSVQIITDTTNDESAINISSAIINNRSDYIIKFYFIYVDINTDNILPIENTFISDYNIYEISDTKSISENLSNSWDNMWNTPMFAWTKNTPFKASVNGFTQIFGISQESGIESLLAYIMTITCIYVVIDIVLALFTWITHTIGER